MALAVVYFFAPQGLGHHLIYDGLGLSSVAAILIGVRMHKPAVRTPWYLFAAGQMCFVVGDGIRAFYETVLGVESPFPGAADAAYIAAYPLLMVGLMMFVRSRDKANDRGNLIDALIVATSVGVVSWIYLMEPYTSDPHVNWLEMVISIAYPLMDLLLLGVAARLMVSPGVRPVAYYLLCASLVALMASDSAYTVTLLNETYHTGSLVDAGWLVSYVLIGAAALHPSVRDVSKSVPQRELRLSNQRLALLAGASLLAPGGADRRARARARAAAVHHRGPHGRPVPPGDGEAVGAGEDAERRARPPQRGGASPAPVRGALRLADPARLGRGHGDRPRR